MAKHPLFDVFVAHAETDAPLAQAVQTLLSRALDIKVFCSSDTVSMRLGKPMASQVFHAHQHSRAVVAVMTPNSIRRTWPIIEAAGAEFSVKPLFVMYSNGLSPNCLPDPIRLWQAGDLRNRVTVASLVEAVGEVTGKKSRICAQEMSAVVRYASVVVSTNWTTTQSVLAGERLGQSPFTLDCLIHQAKRKVFLAGPTLYHLTQPGNGVRYQKELYKWLEKAKRRRLEILIPDVQNPSTVAAYQLQWGKIHVQHLRRSTSEFARWIEDCPRSIKGRLVVKVLETCPLSVVVVDPDDEKAATLVFAPLFYPPRTADRPHFVVTRRENSRIFSYYWDEYTYWFNAEARDLMATGKVSA